MFPKILARGWHVARASLQGPGCNTFLNARYLGSGCSTSGPESTGTGRAVPDRELPEVIKPGSEIGARDLDEAALAQRQDAAVKKFLEHTFGKGRVDLVRILQRHQVVVRGGQEQGTKLMDALSALPQDVDRGAIANVLQAHHAAIRGAPEQAQKLLDSLLEWRRQPCKEPAAAQASINKD